MKFNRSLNLHLPSPSKTILSALTITWSLCATSVYAAQALAPPGAGADPVQTRAEVPTIQRDVHLVNDDQFNYPHIPSLTTTIDGRIGVSHKGRSGGYQFNLMVPEKFGPNFDDTSLVDSPNGTHILSAGSPHIVGSAPFTPAGRPHIALCDATLDPNSSRKNPYVCNGNDDCYDVTIINGHRLNNNRRVRLAGTPVTIRVNNPKTPQAEIVDISVGQTVTGTTFDFTVLFEPMVVEDGHLLVGRTSRSTFTNGNGQRVTSDAVYLTNDNPDNWAACDVRQFNKAYPLSHAPFDATINNRYGFAMQRFRDASGVLIPNNAPLGRYPWISKDGANVSLTTSNTRLFGTFPARCPLGVGPCATNNQSEDDNPLTTRVMWGLWTNGKMVVLDNLINNVDYGVRGSDSRHRELQMYRQTAGHAGSDRWVRVGAGREANAAFLPPTSAGNTTFFDTTEHRFNFIPGLQSSVNADVKWIVNKGVASDDFAFDDYTNPNGFIVSNMSQSVRYNRPVFVDHSGVGQNTRLVNNATAPANRWSIPRWGILTGGRIESVANGGVNGKGLWLESSQTRVNYIIPSSQPNNNLASSARYISIFFDPRFNGAPRKLLTFSDGSEVRVGGIGNKDIYFVRNGNVVRQINVPNSLSGEGWSHLGLHVRSNGTVLTYFNGFLMQEAAIGGAPLFRLIPGGNVYVGHSPDNQRNSGPVAATFEGWVDDFKIFLQPVNQINPEVACNHANGTIAGVRNNNGRWPAIANAYPNSSHSRVRAFVNRARVPTDSRYVCYADYRGDNLAHAHNIPGNLRSVREAITFPEGPLVFNQPRPNSSSNQFCLSCHKSDSLAGLGLGALGRRPNVNAMNDPRRQPSQPEPVVRGVIPANWLGPNLPAARILTGPNGAQIDRWLLRD